MDYAQVSAQLISLLGGKENITGNYACMTRLRISLKDASRVNTEDLRKVDGVLGVVENNPLQVVFGPGKVNRVLEEFEKLTGISSEIAENAAETDQTGAASEAAAGRGKAGAASETAAGTGKDGAAAEAAAGRGKAGAVSETAAGRGKDGAAAEAAAGTGKAEAASEAAAGTDQAGAMAAAYRHAQNAKFDKPVQRFLKRIADIFIVLLPGIIAAGMINGITNVINVSTLNALSGIWWYECIRTMGWAMYAYLPVLVGLSAAREFGGSGVLGAIAGAMSVANPSMPLLVKVNDIQPVIPFTGKVFNPAGGGLLAALIAGMFFAFLEKRIRSVMPDLLDTFFSPLLVLVIGGLMTLILIQPVSAVLTREIYAVLIFAYGKMGAPGGYVLAAGFLPLVAVGLHQALLPIHAMLNDPAGPTQGINYLLPILMMAGGGQVGAGIALYVKSKNGRLRHVIRSSIPVGILGIGEPMMYAVTLPLGRPFVTACLGAGLGGIAAKLLHLGAVSQGVAGLFGLLIMIPGQQLSYLAAMAVSYAGGFVFTWFWGVDEDRISSVYGEPV